MNKGFTIVELLAVIALLALIFILVTPAYDTVNNNIRLKNYNSRKTEIKTQTLSFVEKYIKDKVYDGQNSNVICFTPEFLIRNGIITSDSDKEEYIKNDYLNLKYSGTSKVYIIIKYDDIKYKLIATTIDEKDFDEDTCSKIDNSIF